MDSKSQKILTQSGWLASLPNELRSHVLGKLRTQSVTVNASIFRQGDDFKGLCCVLSGQLHVTGLSEDGMPLLMGILRPGDWTGFLAALDGGGYAFTVSSVGEARVGILEPHDVRSIFESNLAAYKFLARPQIEASRSTYHYFIEYFGRPPLNRVAERLIGLGRWPYSESVVQISPLDHVSQETIAAATRLSRQTINTCLKELEQRGLVKTGYGKVEILSVTGLVEVANGR